MFVESRFHLQLLPGGKNQHPVTAVEAGWRINSGPEIQAQDVGHAHEHIAMGAQVTRQPLEISGLLRWEMDALRAGERPVGRASIFRILDELERLHLVQKLQVGQAMARYEPVRTGAGHHHHLVCDNCGTVMPFTDTDLEDAIKNLSRRVPMRVAEHEIVLHGACQDCSD